MNLSPLRDVITLHGIDARRHLGQNFILDTNLTLKIARLAGDLSGHEILEVGPGPGGLTRALLSLGAKRVVVIEKDPRCVDAMLDLATHFPGRLDVIAADALTCDETHMFTAGAQKKVVANLPYNIATPLLIKWLKAPRFFESYTLMFQKEVGERIVARPRSKAYGRLSVITQWLCQTEILLDVPQKAFVPPPKVMSTIVSLKPREAPLAPADPVILSRVLAAAFGQRRKMLRSSLRQILENAADHLAAIGLNPEARAEELSVEDFCRLATYMENTARNRL